MTAHDIDDPADPDLFLEELAADLVSERRHEPLLASLFAAPAGVWHDLGDLAQGHPLVAARLAEADDELLPIHVCWLDLPNSIHGDGYCTITFYCERGHLYCMALYNKGRLERGEPHPPRAPRRLLN